jgi:hypothetical protein
VLIWDGVGAGPSPEAAVATGISGGHAKHLEERSTLQNDQFDNLLDWLAEQISGDT